MGRTTIASQTYRGDFTTLAVPWAAGEESVRVVMPSPIWADGVELDGVLERTADFGLTWTPLLRCVTHAPAPAIEVDQWWEYTSDHPSLCGGDGVLVRLRGFVAGGSITAPVEVETRLAPIRPPAHRSIGHVSATGISNAMTAALAVTIPSTTAGNTLILGTSFGNTTATITSIDGMTETLVLGPITNSVRGWMYYENNIPAGTTVITVNFSESGGCSVIVQEKSGVHETAVLDTGAAENSATGTSTTPEVSPSPNVNEDNELLVQYAHMAANQTWTADADYTLRVGSLTRAAMQDRILATAAADTATLTGTASAAWVTIIGCFREEPAGAPPAGPPVGSLLSLGVGR